MLQHSYDQQSKVMRDQLQLTELYRLKKPLSGSNYLSR